MIGFTRPVSCDIWKVMRGWTSRCALVIFLLAAGCVHFKQSIFRPRKIPAGVEPEVVRLKEGDGVEIEGWFFWKAAPHTLLVFHGAGGNLYTYVPALNALFTELQVNVFAIDYRGYGRSSGEPSEPGIYADALRAYDYLVGERGIPPRRLIVYGFSLGSAPAVHLAGKREVAAVVLEGAFTAVVDAIEAMADSMGGRAVIKTGTRLDNLGRISSYSGRLLVMHSRDDTMIPPEQGRRLFDASPSRRKKFLYLQGRHCRAWEDDRQNWLNGFDAVLEGLR